MNSVQADGTFGSPHVEAHSETMRDVVMHSLFHATTKLCKAKAGKRSAQMYPSLKGGRCGTLLLCEGFNSCSSQQRFILDGLFSSSMREFE